jgi:hypothetical protein
VYIREDRDSSQNRGSTDHSTPNAIQTIQDVGYCASCGPNLSKLCVPCTFEFLISASPHPKLTTLGISLGGAAGKTPTRITLLQTPEMPRQVLVDRGGRVGPVGSETTPTVTSGPYSTTAGRRSTTLYCGDNSCRQQCHCSRAQQGGPCVWSADARVLGQ